MNYDHIVEVMKPIILSTFGVNTNPNVYVELSTQFDKTVGLIVLMGPNNYKILFHPEQQNPLRVICHELIHVAQHQRGDVFQIELPYAEQPHEIEAYAREQEMVDIYLSINSNVK